MLRRGTALRSLLLQATFLSGSLAAGAVAGSVPSHAQQACTSGGAPASCTVLPQGQIQITSNGANGTNSDDTSRQGGVGSIGGAVSISSASPVNGALTASTSGGGGGGGYNASGFSSASSGGNGGNGGSASISSTAALSTPGGTTYSGIAVISSGGGGGIGGAANLVEGAQPGGAGGDGGTVAVTNSGTITIRSSGTAGIYGVATGGSGGVGGYASSVDSGDSGRSGNGGQGGAIVITNLGAITTFSSNGIGIKANGNGGSGGNGAGLTESFAVDSSAGNGGGGAGASSIGTNGIAQGSAIGFSQAAVAIKNYGAITIASGAGIAAYATGGFGGLAGAQTTSQGGNGGQGGLVYVRNAAGIVVSGDTAFGIGAIATGGAGSQGGTERDGGGNGGTGGNGGIVTIVNVQGTTVQTNGSKAFGVYAQANGGVGGVSGFNSGLSASGGGGGNAGTAFITHEGAITTAGPAAHGVYAAAVGGASGGILYTANSGGGVGGTGGTANATVNSAATTANTIATTGAGAHGILVNASGGAGGPGDNGGMGGNAGTAMLHAYGIVTVFGANANGVVVLAQGGTGGNAEVDNDGNRGAGGGGGAGGNTFAYNQASVVAQGANAIGVLVSSSGGSGGYSSALVWPQDSKDAGNATLVNTGPVTVTSAAGGAGIVVEAIGGQACGSSAYCGPAAGGNGGTVTATVNNSVSTAGVGAPSSPGGFVAPAILLSGNGGNGGYGATYTNMAAIGGGGSAGAVSLTVSPLVSGQTIRISTLGASSPGIVATADGGAGGTGMTEDEVSYIGSGGVGGAAGQVTVNTYSRSISIVTSGDRSPGIFATSFGGTGGTAYSSASEGNELGGNGAAGGAAGGVIVKNGAAISTTGNASSAIVAQSAGGAGGTDGSSSDGQSVFSGNGGTGVVKGSNGVEINAVAVTNIGTLHTTGATSYGILVSSTGGNGGEAFGGNATAGVGAPGGNVSVINGGTITTEGDSSHAIVAMTVGGGGGAGGSYSAGLSLVVDAVGGAGGAGAAAGNSDVTNSAAILTLGDSSNGVFALSVGGGGGNGGSASGSSLGGFEVPSIAVTVGGKGGSGATGGDITVTNTAGGVISTAGADSAAIRALTLGGAGGVGGSASATTYSAGFGDAASINVTISVAGSGGSGGTGGTVTLTNDGRLTTLGDQSAGILALSLGGGGGEGGNAYAQSIAYGVSTDVALTVTIGGSGGAGSSGEAVTVNNQNPTSSILTYGYASDGIMAVSLGGGGGNGGIGSSSVQTVMPLSDFIDALPLAFNTGWSANLTIGGDGGQGGTGGNVTVTNNGTIAVFGADSRGIFAQSVGGSGGNAAAGQATASQDRTFILSIGGSGGSGGNGGAVTVNNDAAGLIFTTQDGAHGIVAQSIGGGGGTGGTATADASGSAAAELGDSVAAMVINKIVQTYVGKLAQFDQHVFEPSVTVNLSFGGSGGAGGNGGDVKVGNAGTIATGGAGGSGGDVAFGIFAQSIGGGGGAGGAATVMGTRMIDAEFALGARGGAYGYGGNVTVSSTGAITTTGDSAFGVLAQSVGGGGGLGGLATDLSQIVLIPTITLGGDIAAQNNSGGGTVKVAVAGIATRGAEAHAVVAQSIGGGGGLFFFNQADYESAGQAAYQSEIGSAVTNAVGSATLNAIAQQFATDVASSSAALTLNLGGPASSASDAQGNGGKVEVTLNGAVSTTGTAAFGVLAQSIGGGGGFATDGSGLTVSTTTVKGQLGGALPLLGADMSGGTVTVTLAGEGGLYTSGTGAAAVVAQSIGGGGGYTGAINATGASYAAFLPVMTSSWVLEGNVQGGSVTVATNGYFSIYTAGDNAHGIVAQSVSGGGGLVGNGNGIILPDTAATNTSRALDLDGIVNAQAGTVSVNYTGMLLTPGAGSVAIFAQSGVQGTSGALDRTNGQFSGAISINIGADSTIMGGAAQGAGQTGAAIVLDGGGTNTITIQDGAYVAAASGLAVASQWGSNTLTNYGTISGDILLVNTSAAAGGGSSFQNMQGATYRSNVSTAGTINLGANGIFNNAGTFDIGGVGDIATATLTGQFQMSNGTVLVDVAGAGSSDLLTMTSVAAMTGTIKVNVMGPLDPTSSYTVMSLLPSGTPALSMEEAAAAVTATTKTTSGVNLYWAVSADEYDLNIAPRADFVGGISGLTPNQAAYARHLQSTWNAGGSGPLNQVYADLINLPSTAAYRRALATSGPEMMMAAPLASVIELRSALTAVMSCPEFQAAGTQLVQGDCTWARIDASRTSYTPGDYTGFTLQGITYRMGAQKEFAPGWFAGLAADVMLSSFDQEFGYAQADGQSVGVSAALKHEAGPWLLSAATHFGYGWFSADRSSVIGSHTYMSSSSYEVLSAALRLRAEYEIPFKDWYLKPAGQVDLIYATVPGFTEGGHGSAYDLAVAQSDGFTAALSPYVEFGARLDLPDGSTLRPYGIAGLTWYSDRTWTMDASLVAAPVGSGTFSATADMPDLVGNMGLGLQWSSTSGVDLRANYEADFGANYLSQTGTLRFSMRF
ncbi:autotransporter outer membrane beta-barrel domain-containing protein [Xanthobacter sp. V2C-8]|uniref:hypothetical protein n=1 Tax=Xanthobacter albus TaxID=3119929 RepID=UPI00372CD28D